MKHKKKCNNLAIHPTSGVSAARSSAITGRPGSTGHMVGKPPNPSHNNPMTSVPKGAGGANLHGNVTK